MSIRERSPGVFEVTIWGHARPDGSRPRKSKTVHGGIRAARRAERDLLIARDKGKLDVKTPTLKTYADSWQAGKAGEVSAKTAEKHEYALSHITPALGRYRVGAVNAIVLRGFKGTLVSSGLSGTTQRMVWDVLSQMMKAAVHEGFIGGNPCALVKPPAKDTAESEHLTKTKWNRLRKAIASDPRVLIVARLMVGTGARPGEALALTWPDLDLEAETVRLTATKTAHQTKAGERVVPLAPELVRALKGWRSDQNALRLKAGDKWIGSLVFPSRLGKPWTVPAFRQAWKKAGGNGFCTPYALRHTYGTWMRQAGMRPELLAWLMGHAKTTTTLNTYSHVDADELKQAREIMAGALS